MKYALWVFGIGITMLCLKSVDALDGGERVLRSMYPRLDASTNIKTGGLQGYLFPPGARYFWNSYGVISRIGWSVPVNPPQPLRFFYFNMSAYSDELYLQSCLKISSYLKSRGAKVILIELPPASSVTETYQRRIAALSKLEEIIFGEWLDHGLGVRHPVFGREKIKWCALSTTMVDDPDAGEFLPYRLRESMENYTVPDASLSMISMWNEGKDSVDAQEEADAVRFQNISIPVSPEGAALINYGVSGDPWWANQINMGGEVKEDGTLEISVPWNPDKAVMKYLATKTDSIAQAKFSGKIVWVYSWQTARRFDNSMKFSKAMSNYPTILSMILSNQFITRIDAWDPIVILLMAAILALVCYRLRAGLALLATILLCACIFLFSFWLCNAHNLYWPPTYLLATILLGTPLLLGVKRSYNRQEVYEGTIQSLEDRAVAMGSELRTAHDMQMALMPTKDPVVPGFFVSGMCKPAESVGGDYYDYVWLDDKTKLGIAVADVSGKAMKAAMTAVMTSGLVVREIGGKSHPAEILQKINLPMYLKTEKKMFTAMVFAMIDTTTKQLTYANAGQSEPILKRGSEIIRLRTEGLRIPLGVQEKVFYNESTVQLQSGDFLLLYTDGLTEATNEHGEMFGVERVDNFLKNFKTPTIVTYFLQTLFYEVDRFAGSAKQHDDITAVGVQIE